MSEGVAIRDWFLDNHAIRWASAQGAEGLDWQRSGNDYCYIWVEAFVDHDLVQYYLLDVRTSCGEGPFNETRDYLFVQGGMDGRKCEWQNSPIEFAAELEAHRERDRCGWKWFTDRIELNWDDYDRQHSQ